MLPRQFLSHHQRNATGTPGSTFTAPYFLSCIFVQALSHRKGIHRASSFGQQKSSPSKAITQVLILPRHPFHPQKGEEHISIAFFEISGDSFTHRKRLVFPFGSKKRDSLCESSLSCEFKRERTFLTHFFFDTCFVLPHRD